MNKGIMADTTKRWRRIGFKMWWYSRILVRFAFFLVMKIIILIYWILWIRFLWIHRYLWQKVYLLKNVLSVSSWRSNVSFIHIKLTIIKFCSSDTYRKDLISNCGSVHINIQPMLTKEWFICCLYSSPQAKNQDLIRPSFLK